jgi:hypothetical protein
MTLSKGVNLSGLQVQTVVARVNFPHEGTQGLISNSWGTVKKSPIVLLQATCKTISLSVSPTPSSGCQAQGVNVCKIQYNMQHNKLNNNAIK